jgi:hypothetical protein
MANDATLGVFHPGKHVICHLMVLTTEFINRTAAKKLTRRNNSHDTTGLTRISRFSLQYVQKLRYIWALLTWPLV